MTGIAVVVALVCVASVADSMSRRARLDAHGRSRSSVARVPSPQRGRDPGGRPAASMEAVLPELIDQLVVAASAGLSPAAALLAVARQAPEPLRSPMVDAARSLRAGTPFERCTADLADALGPAALPLVMALADASARGTPLAPAMRSVAREARDVRRRQVQVRARRLPVRLLFPLVLCTLPAAVLVSVVPVVVVAMRSLAL